MGVEDFTRIPADQWLVEDRLTLLVGPPGAGKSSLLKFTAVDLSSESPTSAILAQKLGSKLPIWLPFGFLCRHIKESTSNSLLSAVKAWLTSQDASAIWDLVAASLDDARLLLIIDGLDEWPDVPHAEIAIGLVEDFLNSRPTASAIVSCRPYALTRLPITLPWHRSSIAPLSNEQQLRLARQTLLADRLKSGGSQDYSFLTGRTQSEAENLLAEIGGVPQLTQLARVPLFLVLLASVWQGEPLPPRRFDVYRRLVQLLLVKHPQLRRRASRAARPSLAVPPDSAQSIFAFIAYALRSDNVTGVTGRAALRRITIRALRDEAILGYDDDTARKLADSVLALGEEEIGLIVSHGTGKVGFLHRVVFEQLAGEHLATLTLDEQSGIFQNAAGDPGWRDVLLATLASLQRPTDVEALLDASISAWPEDSPQAMSAWELVADAVGAGVRITIPALNAYLAQLQDRIENHPWLEHRARLLTSLTNALLVPHIDSRLRPVFKRWMRAPLESPASAVYSLRNLSSLQPQELWRSLRWGLQHPDTEVQINAAAAIAHRAGDLHSFLHDLEDMIYRAVSTSTQASALYCLLRGWPDHPRRIEFLEWATAQQSFSIRIVALQAIMGIGQDPDPALLSQDDSEWLLSLLDSDEFSQDAWTSIAGDLVNSVAQGNSQVADLCFDTLEASQRKHNRYLCWHLACSAFSDDPRARKWVAAQFEDETHPLVMYNKSLMPERWREDTRLTTAVTNHIKRRRSSLMPRDLYELSRFAVCNEIRDQLIEDLDTSWPWWSARALLRDYPDDIEVKNALAERLLRSDRQAGLLAPVAVEVLGVEEALPLLVQLVTASGGPSPSLPYAAVSLAAAWRMCLETKAPADGSDLASEIDAARGQALTRRFDPSVLAQSCLLAAQAAQFEGASDEILLAWPTNPDVQEHAGQLLWAPGPRIATILRAFDGIQEPGARKLIDGAVDSISYLEPELREVIATLLQQPEFPTLLVCDVLEDWQRDYDRNVRRLCVIALATTLHPQRDPLGEGDAIGRRRSGFENTIRDELRAYGLELDHRRQAAWTAMLLLGRLDLLQGVVETIGEAAPVSVGLTDIVGTTDPVLVELVARNWAALSELFGSDLPRRLSGRRPDHRSPWGALATVADRYADVADALQQALKQEPDLLSDSQIAEWIARIDSSDAAFDVCLSILRRHNRNDVPRVLNLMLETDWRMSDFEIKRRILETGWGLDEWALLRGQANRRVRGRWIIPLFAQLFPDHELTHGLYDELTSYFREGRRTPEWSWESAITAAIMGSPATHVPLLLHRIHCAILVRDLNFHRALFVGAAQRRLRSDGAAADALRASAVGGSAATSEMASEVHAFERMERLGSPGRPDIAAAWRTYFFSRMLLGLNLEADSARSNLDNSLRSSDLRTIVTDPLTGAEMPLSLALLTLTP